MGTVPATGLTPVTDQGGPPTAVQLPSWRSMAGRAAVHLLEATLVPLGLFYLVLALLGLRWALLVALTWSYAALARRAITGRRLPGVLLIASGLFTVRTGIALVAHSVFVYFLQPTLGTFLVAGLFLASVPLRRPLAERLARDFCPLPDSVVGRGTVRRFFMQISLLWALVYLVNGAATLTLLLTSSLGTFLVLKTVASTLTTVTAVAVSYLWFHRSLRAEDLVLRWARGGGGGAPSLTAAHAGGRAGPGARADAS